MREFEVVVLDETETEAVSGGQLSTNPLLREAFEIVDHVFDALEGRQRVVTPI